MADNKVCSIRADEGTINKFKEITEQFPNGGECLKALITAHEIAQAKATVTGQETNISDFQAHIDSIVRAYIYSLDLTANTEERVREEFRQRIDSQAQTIADLQTKLKTAEEYLKTVTAESNEKVSKAETDRATAQQTAERATAQQTAESLEKELQQTRKELTQAEKLATVTTDRADSLKAEVESLKARAEKSDEYKSECEQLRKQIETLTAENKKLEAAAQQSEQNHRKELDTALRLQKAELTEQFNQKSEQTQAQHTAQITALLESMNKQNAKEE